MAVEGSHFFPETYAWTMYRVKPPKKVSEMEYGSNERGNITRDQEKKFHRSYGPIFKYFDWKMPKSTISRGQIH